MDCFRLSPAEGAQLPVEVTDELNRGNYFVRTETSLEHQDNLRRAGVATALIRDAKGQAICPDRPYEQGLLGTNLGGTCTATTRFGYVCREEGLGSSERLAKQKSFTAHLDALLTKALQSPPAPATATATQPGSQPSDQQPPSVGQSAGEQPPASKPPASKQPPAEQLPTGPSAAEQPISMESDSVTEEDRCMTMLQDIHAMCVPLSIDECASTSVCEYSDVAERCQLHHDLFHACDVPILGGRLM